MTTSINTKAISSISNQIRDSCSDSFNKRCGQYCEAYKPCVTCEHYIDYYNDVWRTDNGFLVATQDEIASQYFAQMRAKRSGSNSSSSKDSEAVQKELSP